MPVKTCPDCKLTKDLSRFSKNKRKSDGYDTYCKPCVRVRSAAHYQCNKERRIAQHKAWLAANPGKSAEYCKKWRTSNPDKSCASDAKWYAANRDKKLAADKSRRESNLTAFIERERAAYAKFKENRAARSAKWRERNKPTIAAHAAKRRTAKAERTPDWLTDEQHERILAFYIEAYRMENETGIKYHVDHVIPLRGKDVCGLHVPWNLQIISATDNLKKSNSHAT